jgi:hypothetical protein
MPRQKGSDDGGDGLWFWTLCCDLLRTFFCGALATVIANSPENAGKRRKMQETQIGDKSSWDQSFGGAKNPAPFSGLLKLIVDQNWGATTPFPP